MDTLTSAIRTRYAQLERTIGRALPISIDVYNSNDSVKKSYHVLVKGVCFHDHHACSRIAHDVVEIATKTNPALAKTFDSSVYSSKRNLRLLHSRKIDSTRVKTFGCTSYRSPEYKAPDENITTRLLSSLVSYVSKCQYVQRMSDTEIIPRMRPVIEETLQATTVRDALDLVNELLPGVFFFREVRKKAVFLKRLKPAKCPICERVHDNENAMVVLRRPSMYDAEVLHFVCMRDTGVSIPLQSNEEVILPLAPDDVRSSVEIGEVGVQESRGSDREKRLRIESYAEKIVRMYPFSA